MGNKWIKYQLLFFILTWAFNYIFNFYPKIPAGEILPYTVFFAIDNAILIGYFYGLMYCAQFLLKKIPFLIPFLLISMIVACMLLSLVPYSFYIAQGLTPAYSYIYIIKMFEVSYITFSSIGFLFLQKWDESANQKIQLIEALSHAELRFLRTQMSPHFLLNTLNSIFSLALNKSPETYAAISELKTIYTYVQHNENKVSLINEIEYLKNFINMQMRRFGEAVVLKTDFTTDADYLIEPLLLSTFVENAFKHGVSMKEPSFINIRLQVKNGKLAYSIENSDHSSKYKDATSGIGLQNLSRRLELLYPDIHVLQYHGVNSKFISSLTISQL